MNLTKSNYYDAFDELTTLFKIEGIEDQKESLKNDDEDAIKDHILELCTDLYADDILSAETALVLDSLKINVPTATLIDLGISDIKDYDFGVKSEIKEEIKKVEPKKPSIKEDDETYTENTDMVAISQSKLKGVLKLLAPAVGNKNSMIINAMHIIFDYDKLYTFNGEICGIQPLITRVNGSISFKYFNAIINKFKPDDLIQISSEDRTLKLSSGKCKFILEMDETMPPDFDLGSVQWLDLPVDFLRGIEVCHDSAHNNEDEGLISCVYMKGDRLISFDNLRAMQYVMQETMLDTMLIPKKVAKLCYNVYEPVSVGVSEAWILFKNKAGFILGAKTMFGEFPSTRKVFKKRTGDIIKFDQKKFTSLLQRASIVADEDDEAIKSIELELFPLKLICRAGSEIGMFEEELDIQYTGDQKIIRVPSNTIIDIIKHSDELFICENALGFAGENMFGVINAKI